MKYKGGKGRIADEILAIMLNSMLPDQTFIDAFCGGCAVIQRVPREYRRIANDNNRNLIAMLQRLTTDDKWKPPTDIPRNFYNDVRTSYYADDGRYDDALIGWVGWMASRNGRFFDGSIGRFQWDIAVTRIGQLASEMRLSTGGQSVGGSNGNADELTNWDG